jgi:hypothetical protein
VYLPKGARNQDGGKGALREGGPWCLDARQSLPWSALPHKQIHFAGATGLSAKLALVDADALLHRLLFDLLQDELAEWPSPRVLELLEEAGASEEQGVALRVRAVQMQGEFFVAWTRAGADRD